MIIRKSFLLELLMVSFSIGLQAQDVKTLKLSAHMVGEIELYDGKAVDIWGFMYTDSVANADAANQLPSPVLEFVEGDSIYMILDNTSGAPHTVHLHGMDVGQANDGVPCTSFQVGAYALGTYRVRAKHPGTFLYHCHFETHIHLQMGMYGPVIVRPEGLPNAVYDEQTKFTKEYVWLASELDSDWHAIELANGMQPAYEPEYFLLNGKEKQQLSADAQSNITAMVGDTVLIRVANMGYGINQYIFPESLKATVVGSDGRKFDQFIQSDTLMVYPGERYAVFLYPEEEVSEKVVVQYLDNYQDRLWGQNEMQVDIFARPLHTDPQDNIQLLRYGSQLRLSLPQHHQPYQVQLFDLSGRVYYNKNVSAPNLEINIADFSSRVAIVRVTGDFGVWQQKLLLK